MCRTVNEMTTAIRWIIRVFLVVLAFPPADESETGLKLASLYAQQVDRRVELPEAEQLQYAGLLATTLSQEGLRELPSQFVLLVDRSPLVQVVMLYRKSNERVF